MASKMYDESLRREMLFYHAHGYEKPLMVYYIAYGPLSASMS